MDKSRKQPRVYGNMVPRGEFADGQGIIRKQYRFHNDVGNQSGLTDWFDVQVQDAANIDPELDACSPRTPTMLGYGFDSLTFTLKETLRRTKDFCARDWKHKWEFKQQMESILGSLGEQSNTVWDNFVRENFMMFAAAENRFYVLSEGSPDGTTLELITATRRYDPFTTKNIKIDDDVKIGTLNWRFFQWWHQNLSLDAPGSANGMTDGMPMWDMILHPDDFDWMIHNDSELAEDFRYFSPSVLIDNYGSVKQFKGYNLFYDKTAPRYAAGPASSDGTFLTLSRVDPFISAAATKGTKWTVNPAYLNAQYAVALLRPNDAFRLLIPPAGPSNVAGAKFMSVGYNGTFGWINYPDRHDNIFGEKGFYIARFTGTAEPMEFSDQVVAVLYKRCPHNEIVLCAPCEGGSAGAKTVTAAVEIVGTGEAANAVTEVDITLDSCLDGEAPADLYIDYDGGSPFASNVTAIIVDDHRAPTYRIAFTSAGDWVAAGTIVAGTTKVQLA